MDEHINHHRTIETDENFDSDDLLTSNDIQIEWTAFVDSYVLILLFSLLVFFNASRIVRNPFTFYVASAVGGVFASLIFVAFVLQKLLPKRALAFPLYLGGWPLSIYIYYKAWQNFELLATNYHTYLVAYIITMALLSTAICYRFGPPSHPKTLNLIKWIIQLLAFAGIYLSCRNFYFLLFENASDKVHEL